MRARIKIFLAGYVDYINAQNLNCLALANYLDDDKFEILTLSLNSKHKQDLNFRIFYCIKPYFFSKYIGFLWGILNSDICYFPKHIDTPLWILKFARLINRPIFTTLEGNVMDRSKDNLVDLFGSLDNMLRHFSFFNKVFPITKHISSQVENCFPNISTLLHLGVDYDSFFYDRNINKLKKIAFVGGLIKRKRVEQMVDLALLFPNLYFEIIGDGDYREELMSKSPKNVFFRGRLSQIELKEAFKTVDLLFLPSVSEGFPKVILEAACASIPSVVYGNYGADEWIKHNSNGFVVSEFNDVVNLINNLLSCPNLLQSTSKNTSKLAYAFDWRKIILKWEKEILFMISNNEK